MRGRWGFLSTWLAPVRGRLRISRRPSSRASVPYMRYAGLELQLPPTAEASREELRKVREALALLSLVARVDPEALKRVLVDYCNLSVENQQVCTDSDEFVRPWFVVELKSKVNDVRAAEVFAWLFPGPDEQPRGEFLAAATRVVSWCPRRVSIPGQIHIAVDVVITPDELGVQPTIYKELEPFVSVLRAIRTSHYAWHIPMPVQLPQQDPASQTQGLKCSFVIKSIELDLLTHPTHVKVLETTEGSTSYDGTEAGSLILSSLVKYHQPDDSDSGHEAQQTGRLFTATLNPTGSFRASRSSNECVHISSLLTYPGSIARMSSAVAVAQSTKTIFLHFDDSSNIVDAMGSWIWQHMAYALFSKHSQSAITHVKLQEIDITEEDVQAMELIMNQDDPIPLLYPGRRLSGADNQRARLPKGTRVTIEQIDPTEDIRAQSATWMLDSDVDYVQVLRDANPNNQAGDSVHVVVPGYGLCKVSRDDLQPSRIQDIVSENEKQKPRVTSLHLDFANDPSTAIGLQRFLQLIGSSLTHLRLELHPATPLKIPSIFSSCPNLESLAIRGPEFNAAEFVQSYSSFKMSIAELDCSFDNLIPLAHELSNAESRLAKTLKRILVHILPTWNIEKSSCIVFDECDVLLSNNNKLEYVLLGLPGRHGTIQVEPYWPGVAKLMAHHDNEIPVAISPLPLECRLAFLSIFMQGKHRDKICEKKPKLTSSAWLVNITLDRTILTTIFEFAAICMRRQVYLEPTCRQYVLEPF